MPTGGEDGQFNNLAINADIYTPLSSNDTNLIQQGSVKVQKPPYRLDMRGCISNGSLKNEPAVGYWWSDTVNNNVFIYGLSVHPGFIHPVDNLTRYYGFSLRCITTPTS